MQDESELVKENLNGAADLEAKLAFVNENKAEMEKEN